MLGRQVRFAGWALLILASCSTPKPRVDREGLTREIHERAAVAPPDASAGAPAPGVDLADGISRDEAIAVSLWRNPDLAASLAELDLARATVFDAGLLRDPVFSLLFPLGHKQLEATLQLPIEALWTRAERIELAQADAERVAADLLRHGVDLVHDVQLEFNALEQARTDAALAGESLRVAREIARLDELRAQAGEIARSTAQASLLAEQIAGLEFEQAAQRVQAGQRALGARLGLEATESIDQQAGAPSIDVEAIPASPRLLEMALACRPDLRAAGLAVEVAARRLGLTREEAWKITAIIDANEKGGGGFDVGPGLSVSLPVFSGSRGTRAIAEAQLEVARARYRSVRVRVAHEVADAEAAFNAARRAFLEWSDRIGPRSRAALETVRRAHAAGEVSAPVVLQSELRVIGLARQEAQSRWQLQQARAELERAVGRRNLEASVTQ